MSGVDFKQFAKYVTDSENRWGKDKLAIWGGECNLDQIDAFLSAWKLSNNDIPDTVGLWTKKWRSIWLGIRRWFVKLTSIAEGKTIPDMPYCIWETDDTIGFNQIPDAETTLQRAHIFGPDGDLSLRRQTDHFLWHFVGKQSIKPPKLKDAPDFSEPANDFWQTEPDAVFLKEEKQSLLWGERKPKQKCWFDDRVGWANLAYPIDVVENSHTRPQLTYRTFSRAGRVEFVWYLKMEAKDEAG